MPSSSRAARSSLWRSTRRASGGGPSRTSNCTTGYCGRNSGSPWGIRHMGRSRFVKGEQVRLPLSDGDFIDIKKSLTHGEREDMLAAIAPTIIIGERRRLDARNVRTAKVLTYLVGWSLLDDGQPVPYSLDLPEDFRRDTLRQLDPSTFDEIHRAIEQHEAADDAERTGKKTVTASPVSKATSDSRSGAPGVTSGSVN